MDVPAPTMDLTTILNTGAMRDARMESLANAAMTAGIDAYREKDYDKAAKAFGRATALSPSGAYATQAYKYLSMACQQLGKNEEAIKAYLTGIKFNPQNADLRGDLGNIYFALERYSEAETQYKAALRLNPSVKNNFALGQLYLKTDRLADAEMQFNKVITHAPNEAGGQFGLGQALAKQKRYDEAISRFQKALALNRDFDDARLEMAIAYADKGDMETAQSILELMKDNRSDLAGMLSDYLYRIEKPRLEFAGYESSFAYKYPMNTPVSFLDAYLEAANTASQFTMVFQFGREMNPASVMNRYNWQISRADGRNGSIYNFGLPIAETEAQIAPFPDAVVYNPHTYQATVTFTIRQNAAADATLDPSHIVFRFSGKDIFGNRMDSDADEFSGFLGIR
jgi:tetratricopeptide (TPR) repeat protein